MSGQIKAGDLVVVVKPSVCGCDKTVGVIFKVTGFTANHFYRCVNCGHRWTYPRGGVEGYPGRQFDPRRLKRIPPIGELDDVKRDEEVTA